VWSRFSLLFPVFIGIMLSGCQATLLKTSSVDGDSLDLGSLTQQINSGDVSGGKAYNTRGVVYARKNDLNKALEDFQNAINSTPGSPKAYTNRALVLLRTGKLESARESASQAIAVDPSYVPAYIARAHALRLLGETELALQDSNQAIRLNPESAHAFHARGLIYQRAKDCDHAVLDFTAANDRDPFAAPPYIGRGECQLVRGQYKSAIEDFNAALHVENNNGLVWMYRGQAYERLGDRKEASISYQNAASFDRSLSAAREGLRRVASIAD
jgi:tetratricopeptide (TPR) repeat protein